MFVIGKSPIIGMSFEKNHETGISEYFEEYFDTHEQEHQLSTGEKRRVFTLEIMDDSFAIKSKDESIALFPHISLDEEGVKELILRAQKFLGGITVSSKGIESYIPPSQAGNLLIRSSGPDASVAVISRHKSFEAEVPMDQAKKVGEWMESLNAVDQAASGVWVYISQPFL